MINIEKEGWTPSMGYILIVDHNMVMILFENQIIIYNSNKFDA